MAKEKLIIFDTTMRDGEQSPGASMTKEEKLRIARQLERMRVDVIEAGFPAASDGDFDAVRAVARSIKDSTVCGLARANENDVRRCGEAVRGARSPRVHTFIATSPIHMEKKLRMEPSQVIDQAVRAVRWAREYTDNVEFSPEDAGRSDIDFLCRILEQVIKAGATTINVPDTVGYTLPDQFGGLIRTLRERIPNSDKAIWSVHCHNDLGLAVANSLSAVLNGARQVECTINGLGERAGNASLEEIVMAVRTRQDMFSCDTGIDTTQIVPASKLVSGHHRLPGATEQGDRRRQRLRARVRHTPGRRAQAPRDLRDHERRSGGLEHQPADARASFPGATRSRRGSQELGIELASEEALNAAFKRFKDLADKKREIFDEDLQALISEEAIDHVESEHYKLVSLTAHSETGEAPLREDRDARRTARNGAPRPGQRPGGRVLQGDREHRQERGGAAALFGQQHHHGHRLHRAKSRCGSPRTGASSTGRAPTPTSWSRRRRPTLTR